MVTSEQRKWMYEQVRTFRKTKAIWSMDFWNDGEYVRGCVAGGRYYLHINANGDAEPCAFIHYSNYNIKDMSLLDVLKSPLFKAYQKGQPFSSNYLRPCPLLDNPERLPEMVDESKAVSTDLAAPQDVHETCLQMRGKSCRLEKDRRRGMAGKTQVRKKRRNRRTTHGGCQPQQCSFISLNA